jgi:hypothetical protein
MPYSNDSRVSGSLACDWYVAIQRAAPGVAEQHDRLYARHVT